jgi:hypothetical protein
VKKKYDDTKLGNILEVENRDLSDLVRELRRVETKRRLLCLKIEAQELVVEALEKDLAAVRGSGGL